MLNRSKFFLLFASLFFSPVLLHAQSPDVHSESEVVFLGDSFGEPGKYQFTLPDDDDERNVS